MRKVRDIYFPDSDSSASVAYAETGDVDPEIRAFALAQCRRFRRAVDVGAHVGLHARPLAEVFNAVEAFEPQAQALECLQANLTQPGCRTHRVALWKARAIGYITRRLGKDSAAAVIEVEQAAGFGPVALRPLDDYDWPDVDLIMVNIGKRAGEVLEGAMKTIARSRPVLWIDRADMRPSLMLELALVFGQEGYRLLATSGRTAILAASDDQDKAVPPGAALVSDADGGRWLTFRQKAGGTSPETRLLLDDQALRVEQIGYRADAGRGALAVVQIPAGFDATLPHFVRRRDGETPVEAGALAETDLDALARERLKKGRFADGVFKFSVPVEWLATGTDVVVTVREAGDSRVIFRRDLREIGNLDEIEARWPLELVDLKPRKLTVHLTRRSGPPLTEELDGSVDPGQLGPDMVNCYMNRGGGGNPVIRAFAGAIGARTCYAEDGRRDGVSVVWGVLRGSKDVIDRTAEKDGIFFYIDHAYFDRGHMKNYRITRNRFEAGRIRRCPPDRIQALGVKLEPWRRGGDYVLVCPPTDYFIKAHGCASWLKDTLAELKQYTDRQIIVREKPRAGESVVPLEEALAGAHALVTHSSNVAVEAVMAGTAVFVSNTSAAAPVGLTDLSLIETPEYPDRDPWLAHLGYSQFSFKEIKYGEAWRLLLDWEQREFV